MEEENNVNEEMIDLETDNENVSSEEVAEEMSAPVTTMNAGNDTSEPAEESPSTTDSHDCCQCPSAEEVAEAVVGRIAILSTAVVDRIVEALSIQSIIDEAVENITSNISGNDVFTQVQTQVQKLWDDLVG